MRGRCVRVSKVVDRMEYSVRNRRRLRPTTGEVPSMPQRARTITAVPLPIAPEGSTPTRQPALRDIRDLVAPGIHDRSGNR